MMNKTMETLLTKTAKMSEIHTKMAGFKEERYVKCGSYTHVH